MLQNMINIINRYLILICLVIFSNCVYKQISKVDCLYVSDLGKQPSSFLEFTFNLEEYDSTKSNNNTKILKVIIDHDNNNWVYYSKKPIEEYYREKKLTPYCYLIKNHIYSISSMNSSGGRKIDRIDFLDPKLPFDIKSIDYNKYGWGGRQIILNIRDTGIVHMRVLFKKDTLHTTMIISKDTLIVKPVCKVIRHTKRTIYLSPFAWIKVFFESIKRKYNKECKEQ